MAANSTNKPLLSTDRASGIVKLSAGSASSSRPSEAQDSKKQTIQVQERYPQFVELRSRQLKNQTNKVTPLLRRARRKPVCGQISARLGQAEEERVLQHFVEAGHACLGRNIRLSGVEIDLLIRTQDSEIWILEVKKISNLQYYERRVTPKQRQRILRVLRFFLESGKKARAHLVLVDSESIRTEMDFFIHDL